MSFHFNNRIISRTYEDTIWGYTYRFQQDENGVTVLRCPEDNLLWSHGVIKQIFQLTEKTFVPACNSGLDIRFSGMREAEIAVGEFVVAERLKIGVHDAS